MEKLITLLLLLPFTILGQQTLKPTISEVSLFPSGAQVKRTIEVDLISGKNSLLFTELEETLDAYSIKVKASNDITVTFLNHQKSSSATMSENQKKLKRFNVAIEQITDEILINNDALKLLVLEEDFLMKNQIVGGTYAGTKPEDLKATASFFKEQLASLYEKKNVLKKANERLLDKIKAVNAEINGVNTQEASKSSEINIEVISESIGKQNFEISYFVPEAGWSPKYNIKVKDIASPLVLQYNANVFQYTGKDWKNVDFILSNGNPRKKGQMPELQPWNWGKVNTYDDYFNTDSESNETPNQVFGQVKSGDDNFPLLGVTVQLKGTSLGVITDQNGYYRINIPPNLIAKKPSLVFSFIGYETQEVIVDKSEIDVTLALSETGLEEVVVVGYGIERKNLSTASSTVIRGSNTLAGKVAGVSLQKTKVLKKLTTDEEQATSKSFKMKDKFTVMSDARVYSATLEELEIPVSYEYRTAPKIDPVAFLTAHITDWESLNLVRGEASLFFEGTYLGKSMLETSDKDTLSVSLGRDESIIINREKIKSYAKKKFMTSSTEEQFEYRITLRNTKKQPVQIIVEDQVPLSTYKEVEVSDVSFDGGTKNNETGKVEWKINLAPSEKKELTLKYTVKYPRSGYVVNQ
ncbi:conserved hypothetical protein [Spirosomataceae bacterium TFI 002]|nr:conserved hypothetical protein [Spirosomataceae bacterium TFI 002]